MELFERELDRNRPVDLDFYRLYKKGTLFNHMGFWIKVFAFELDICLSSFRMVPKAEYRGWTDDAYGFSIWFLVGHNGFNLNFEVSRFSVSAVVGHVNIPKSIFREKELYFPISNIYG